jgi:peptidoglycan-associated lipoprotein
MRKYLMCTFFWKTLLIGAAIWFISATGLTAQTPGEAKAPSAAPSRIDFAFAYSADRSNVVGGSSFWMQGGSAQMHLLFYRALGLVIDFSGWHAGNIQSSGVGLDLVTSTSGLRYTWRPAHTRYSLYGQALAGVASGYNSDFPANSGVVASSQSLALKLGGGLNIGMTRRIALRALEADWLRTQFPNSTNGAQNSCQLNSGLVFRF